MRVLVTGGGGFLGSHIADALSRAGHQVILFDIRPSPYARPDQIMEVGSVLDRERVEHLMRGVQAVYHLAAIADIGVAMRNPRPTIEVNVLGTLNLLEAARAAKIERFVFASSIYVYSDQGSFYRVSKQTGEQLILSYGESFGLRHTILRFGSLYGPRSGPGNAVHDLITQAIAKAEINYAGTGHEVREYIHVLDAAAMAVDILDPAFADQIIHLTGRERLTSREMLEMIREIFGGNIEINITGSGMIGHYIHTPYNFTPRLGRRLIRQTYIDIGLGLLDYIQQRHAEDVEKSADFFENKRADGD